MGEAGKVEGLPSLFASLAF